MTYLDPQMEGDLKTVYHAFASFGSSQQMVDMENKNFVKLAKDCKLMSKTFTSTDCDLIFTKVKAKGARKITWPEFVKAVDQIAAKKGCALDEVVAAIIKGGGPQDNGTKAEAVKWHDDKSTYTGVYAKGGPTNVDMDPKNLAGLCDRSSADVRGVKYGGPAVNQTANRRSTGDLKPLAAGAGRRSTGESAVNSVAAGVKNMKM